MMRRSLFLTLVVVGVVVAYSALRMTVQLGAAQNTGRSIASAAAPVKYAYVVGRNDKAEICFVEAQGCRVQDVTAPPVTFSHEGRIITDMSATQAVAFAKAVSLLGDAGWEMVGPGPAYGTANFAERAMHFRQVGR